MRFSALLSIFHGTKAKQLNDTFTSISCQSILPSELIVVHDGPISRTVHQEVTNFSLSFPVKMIYFDVNRGLGPALRDGLSHCNNDYVARIDSDDRSMPDRFQIQADYLLRHPDVSVVGGSLREWYTQRKTRIAVIRKGEIIARGETPLNRWRNPLNHQTVILKRSAILDVGSYESIPFFEDYHLWTRLIQNNYWITSVPDVLVETDIDLEYFKRRGGISYFRYEFQFARSMRRLSYFTLSDYSIFLFSRMCFRIAPNSVRTLLYRKFLRH